MKVHLFMRQDVLVQVWDEPELSLRIFERDKLIQVIPIRQDVLEISQKTDRVKITFNGNSKIFIVSRGGEGQIK